MSKKEIISQIFEKQNFLCIGLDPDITKIPEHLLDFDDPVFEFCKVIIQNTSDLAVAYKPNLAFFESLGPKGWYTLEKVVNLIPKSCFKIADAKRGDIGNTSKMYAKCFFEYFDFDAVTVTPYMGRDSVEPFLEFNGKWVILLGLTSNPGSADFEMLETNHGKLYQRVMSVAATWGDDSNLMYVVGATHGAMLDQIRKEYPDYFFLVPGVGKQGGSIQKACQFGTNSDGGILINNGREIIYRSSLKDFGNAAREMAVQNIDEMRMYYDFNN